MSGNALEEIARARVGRTLKGKWRLDQVIGVGGMAAVYAATHRNSARVAIKMLHPSVSVSESVRSRFLREGYLANQVDHANVVRVLDDDVDESDGCAFLVMDLVHGRTLAERGLDRLLLEGELLTVAEQVLSVLVAAHAKGIVHRDLKPDNLLVDEQGKVWVLDFGIARLLEETSASATKTGASFGTPGFMSPEQALGKKAQIGPKSDLYALGATLFALACGDFVHDSESPEELVVHTATRQPRSLAQLAAALAPRVVEIVDRATKPSLEERWESAAAMLDAVRSAQAELGLAEVRLFPRAEAASEARGSSAHPSPFHVASRALAAVVSTGGASRASVDEPSSKRVITPKKRRFALLGAATLLAGTLVGATLINRAEPQRTGRPSAEVAPSTLRSSATSATSAMSPSASSSTSASSARPETTASSKPAASSLASARTPSASPSTSAIDIDIGY